MTSYEETQRSVINCLGIQEREDLLDDYFLGKERHEISVKGFLKHIEKSSAPILEHQLIVNSLHVTTNYDQCASIYRTGIKDLQAVVTEDTPLHSFLKERGVTIDVLNAELLYNGKVYPLNRNSTGGSATDDVGLNYVSWKLYTDFPVCGFLCSSNALNYGGHVNKRPEFLNNISNFLNRPELVAEWMEITQAYVVKYAIPLNRYHSPRNSEWVGNLLIETAYDYIFHNGPRIDKYSFLPAHESVNPRKIQVTYTAKEYSELVGI